MDFGVSVTTLEQVFLNVVKHNGAPDGGRDDAEKVRRLSATRPAEEPLRDAQRDGDSQLSQLAPRGGMRNACKHVAAIYVKRFHYYRRDKAAICCTTVLPIMILCAGASDDDIFSATVQPPCSPLKDGPRCSTAQGCCCSRPPSRSPRSRPSSSTTPLSPRRSADPALRAVQNGLEQFKRFRTRPV
jgi:hypothetical protein